MTHVDPFAPADSPLHPSNMHRTTHETMEAQMARRQELAGHRTTREVAEEVEVPLDVLEGREQAVNDFLDDLEKADQEENVTPPTTTDMLGETVTWTYSVPEGEETMRGQWEIVQEGDNPPHDPPAAPEGDDAQADPPQDDKPARRGRRKAATPEELEAARQAALARLDGDQ